MGIEEQIDGLASLEDGWCHGSGKAYDKHDLTWLLTFIKQRVSPMKPLLFPSPSEDNTVSVSFLVAGYLVANISINIHTKTGDYMVDYEEPIEVNFENEEEVTKMMNTISSTVNTYSDIV